MRRFSRRAHRAGLAPGTLKVAARPTAHATGITVTDYSSEQVEERADATLQDCLQGPPPGTNRWINVDGVHDPQLIETLGQHFRLHPLMTEDVVTVAQRSKVEAYGEATYVVVRMLRFDAAGIQIESEQLSIIITGHTLISFQERPGDVFDGVRERLRARRPRICSSGPPYLAYALLDAVVDHYFVLLERIGDHIEGLEDALVAAPTPATLASIHQLKRELIYLRKSVWPLREAISTMLREEGLPFDDAMHVYLRDLHDHAVHVMETIESYRDLNAGMLDLYLSSVSNRMNEIMKTLTIIATLFIPLTFLSSIYGMNFEHMPELHQPWAYPALWAVFLATIAWMLRSFRRRGWL